MIPVLGYCFKYLLADQGIQIWCMRICISPVGISSMSDPAKGGFTFNKQAY
jgi:hypothetical protein